jgi:hypothetical protein
MHIDGLTGRGANLRQLTIKQYPSHDGKGAAMTDQIKRSRGRPPKPEGPVPAADRQALYAKQRARDMAEAAYSLKAAVLECDQARAAFVTANRGTMSGQRLRRGLARLLTDDPDTMAFFDGLISSDDGK